VVSGQGPSTLAGWRRKGRWEVQKSGAGIKRTLLERTEYETFPDTLPCAGIPLAVNGRRVAIMDHPRP